MIKITNFFLQIFVNVVTMENLTFKLALECPYVLKSILILTAVPSMVYIVPPGAFMAFVSIVYRDKFFTWLKTAVQFHEVRLLHGKIFSCCSLAISFNIFNSVFFVGKMLLCFVLFYDHICLLLIVLGKYAIAIDRIKLVLNRRLKLLPRKYFVQRCQKWYCN